MAALALTFGACNKSAGTVPAAAVPTAATPTTATPTAPNLSSAAAAGDVAVRSFLALVYTDEASANPLLKPEDEYDPGLALAMAEDSRLASAANDVGLDYDPICQCQDPTDMRWNITSLALSSPTAARASVLLSWPGPPPRRRKRLPSSWSRRPSAGASTTSPARTPQASWLS